MGFIVHNVPEISCFSFELVCKQEAGEVIGLDEDKNKKERNPFGCKSFVISPLLCTKFSCCFRALHP